MSNLARGNSVSESVRERRIRPLYDLLDSGNFKKVLQESDKILKKTPDLYAAKVFKAIAYSRLGKLEECMTLMDQVFNAHPCDESTLHTMSICYKDLDMPEKVCAMYENAYKKDKSEDMLICCFMSSARVLNYTKQYQVAMELNKNFGKSCYLNWAVMSLYIKAMMVDEQKTAQGVTLPLAARIIEKHISETSSCNEADVYLYVMVLFKMGNYEKALKILDESVLNDVEWNNDSFNRLKVAALLKLNNDQGALLEAIETQIINDPENYKGYQQYVEVSGDANSDRIISLFQSFAFDETAVCTSRAALLGLISYSVVLHDKKIENPLRLQELFTAYLRAFGTRPFFLRDIKKIVKRLKTVDERDMIYLSCAELLKTQIIGKHEIGRKIQRECNLCILNYYVTHDEMMADPFRLMHHIMRYFNSYLYGVADFTIDTNIDTRESCPYENYMIMASGILMESFWNKPNGIWNGFYNANGLRRLALNFQEDYEAANHYLEGGVIPGKLPETCEEYYVDENDFPILLNMTLLEYALKQTPHCYSLKLMLGKLYFFCGAANSGYELTMELDIKHMQIDSLGYLYTDKSLGSGDIRLAQQVLHNADAFYIGHHKEQMEHVISGYKNLSWRQILEFMAFKESIQHSIQLQHVKVERPLLEFTMEGNSREKIVKIAQKEKFDINDLYNNSYEDNRDFKIHKFMFHNNPHPDYKDLTYRDSLSRLKLRTALHIIITNLIQAAQCVKDSQELEGFLSKAKEAFNALNDLMKNSQTDYDIAEDGCLCGPWPPTMHLFLQSEVFGLLLEFFRLNFASAGKGSPHEEVFELMKEIENLVKEKTDAIILKLVKFETNFRAMNTIIQETCIAVESFGFICIMANVLKLFFQMSEPPPPETKGRKKKTKEVPVIEPPWVVEFDSFVKTLAGSLKKFELGIVSLKTSSEAWLPNGPFSEEQRVFWKDKVSTEIMSILFNYLPVAYHRVNDSYKRIFAEMKGTILRKRQYAESLLSSNVNLKVIT